MVHSITSREFNVVSLVAKMHEDWKTCYLTLDVVYSKSTINCRNKSVFLKIYFFCRIYSFRYFFKQKFPKKPSAYFCHKVEIIFQRIISFHFRLSICLYCSKGYYFVSFAFSNYPQGLEFNLSIHICNLLLEIVISTLKEELLESQHQSGICYINLLYCI